MSRPIVRIHNAETKETVDREMNDVEFTAYQAEQEASIIRQAEAEEKETARQAIADRLGLTADELKLLLG